MMKTFEQYNKEYEFLIDAVGFKKFVNEVKTLKKSFSYAEPNKKVMVSQQPHGFITLKSIFTRKNFACYGVPVDSVSNFKKDYANWLVVDENSNNTCNFDAPIESNLAYNILTLENPVNDRYIDIVLFSFCTSLDPRGSYSDDCIIIFDNEYKKHVELDEFLNNYYNLANGSFKVNNVTYTFNLQGCLTDDVENITISDNEDANIDSCVSASDLDDKEQFKEDLNLLLDDNNSIRGAIKDFKINYASKLAEQYY